MYDAGPTLEVRDEVESPVVIDFEMTFTMKDEQMKDEQRTDTPDEGQTKRSWKPELQTLIGNPLPEENREEGACRGDCCQKRIRARRRICRQKAESRVHQQPPAQSKRSRRTAFGCHHPPAFK